MSKFRCQQGCVPSWVSWVTIHFQAHFSYWTNSVPCSCKMEVAVSLLASSLGAWWEVKPTVKARARFCLVGVWILFCSMDNANTMSSVFTDITLDSIWGINCRNTEQKRKYQFRIYCSGPGKRSWCPGVQWRIPIANLSSSAASSFALQFENLRIDSFCFWS